MLKNIVLKCFSLFFLLNGTLATAQKVHLITFCDTENSNTGAAGKKSYDYFLNDFTDMLKSAGLPVDPSCNMAANFTLEGVQEKLNNLVVDKNDVILFWFDGHGANAGGDYPQVIFKGYHRDNSRVKKMEDIYNTLKKKGARLTLVFSNACNKSNGSQPASDAQPRNNSHPPVTYDRAKIRKLFVESRGSAIMTSSKVEQYSYSNSIEGAYFFMAFRHTVETMLATNYRGELDWEAFLSGIATNTTEFAGQTAQFHEQVPLYKYEPRSPNIEPYRPTESYNPFYISAGAGIGEYPGLGLLATKQWGNNNFGFAINGGIGGGILADGWLYASGSLCFLRGGFIDGGILFPMSDQNNSFWTAGLGANIGFGRESHWGVHVSGGVLQDVATAQWAPRIGLGLFFRVQ